MNRCKHILIVAEVSIAGWH